MALEQWYVADYAYLRELRTCLRQLVETQLPFPSRDRDDVAERLIIVATELATNAIQHGQSQAIVRLSRSASTFVLDVADDLPSAAPRITQRQSLEAGGRGLQITQELASDTGWYVQANRKHVWAEFTLPRRVRRLLTPRISIFDLTSLVRLLRRLSN